MGTALDTLGIYEKLKAADLPEKAAKEITEVFRETIEERLATKEDIENLKLELKAEIARQNITIIKWVAGMLVAQAAVIATLVKLL